MSWYFQRNTITYLVGIILLFTVNANAQIRGNVLEENTKSPIPFVHIYVNDGQIQVLSDMDGYFEIPLDSSLVIKKLTFKTYLHGSTSIVTDSLDQAIPLEIYLKKNHFFLFTNHTSDTAAVIMRKVIHRKKENKTDHLKYISYSTYNKATITPERVDNTNRSLHKFFKFFSLKFNTFKEKQHFLIIESVTEKKIYNKWHKKELIKGAKSTIVDVPFIFVQTTQIHAISPYNNFIIVGGKTYVSPLADNTMGRYAFSVLDTITTREDTIFVVKYHPFAKKQFDGLKGLLYINTKNYAIQHYTASPAVEKKLEMAMMQSFQYFQEDKVWFPKRTKTLVAVERSDEIFIATVNTYVSNIDLKSFVNKKQFDEVVLEYPAYANKQDEEFWNKNRAVPLTPYDSNTYIYYDSADQKKFIQRSSELGQNLYYGFITYKKIFDIELKRILDYNQLEGVRIGFGGHTNENFSQRIRLGAYGGYGIKDEKYKFGLDFTYLIRTLPIELTTTFFNDVKESGATEFYIDKYQYSSEPLRRFGLRIMDKVIHWENAILYHPIPYLDTWSSVGISSVQPTYNYQFENEADNVFNFAEVKIGARYGYGEEYIQLLNRKSSIGSKLPILYFQYTQGMKFFLGNYNYAKYDFKIEFNFKILDFGKTGIQVATGWVDGDVPYTRLYNGKGSYRKSLVVVHNSFETMRYNEFLSDRHLSIFLAHDFGRLYFDSDYIKPRLSMLHNFGIGNLRNTASHKNIEFKTMDKGYTESGLLLDDVLVVRIASLRVGAGAAAFLRYGPYANAKFGDNFLFKFALKFSL